jgi:iron complex transport system substrate-binding protein
MKDGRLMSTDGTSDLEAPATIVSGAGTHASVARRARAARLLAGCAVLGSCGHGDAAGDRGTGLTSRVVCVSKQINEFIYDIGAESHLVARDLTSIYPPAITKLPSVGYHRALSAEGIISARPTLFLTDGNVGPDAVLDQLRKVGIPILVLHPGATLDSAEQLMSELGRRLARAQAADNVLAVWRAGMDSVLADSGRWAATARPRVLVMHFGQLSNDYLGLKSGGPAAAMIRWAGGQNAIDSAGGMQRLTPELIARLAPAVIIATDVGFDRAGSASKFATLPGVALTPAAKSGRIYRVDETEVMYFGPRTPATVRKLAGYFHP